VYSSSIGWLGSRPGRVDDAGGDPEMAAGGDEIAVWA